MEQLHLIKHKISKALHFFCDCTSRFAVGFIPNANNSFIPQLQAVDD